MSIKGRSLELYFIDGKPDGMLTAEVFNWTGHVLVIPRTQLKDGLVRQEASYTGVYLLLGEENGETVAYIGESEDVASRIKGHDTNKDWWTSAVIITSSANNLHKAHVKYLESRLVEEARTVGHVKLDNNNTPPRSSLSEASIANMEGFLETLLMVLPALRIDMLVRRTRPNNTVSSPSSRDENAPEFELINRKHNLQALAILRDGEFIVQAGSKARVEWTGDLTNKTSYWKLFGELLKQGILEKHEDHCVFKENYAFSSTSAAGAVINGRSTRGPTEWKYKKDGRTYQEWEADQLKN